MAQLRAAYDEQPSEAALTSLPHSASPGASGDAKDDSDDSQYRLQVATADNPAFPGHSPHSSPAGIQPLMPYFQDKAEYKLGLVLKQQQQHPQSPTSSSSSPSSSAEGVVTSGKSHVRVCFLPGLSGWVSLCCGSRWVNRELSSQFCFSIQLLLFDKTKSNNTLIHHNQRAKSHIVSQTTLVANYSHR